MTRFLRFAAFTTLLLFCLWLVMPKQDGDLFEANEKTAPAAPEAASTQMSQVDDRISKPKPTEGPEKRPTARRTSIPRARMTLREKLAADFPYDVQSFFPAFIWQTWKTTPSDGAFGFREQEATWSNQHPEYVHEVITDDVAGLLIHHLFAETPEVIEAYDALPHAILKADFFRYLVLLARGGIYSDIDTTCLKPCWEWVPARHPYDTYGLVIGIEADPDREDWADWYSRRIQFVQWTIRAKAGHPALIEAAATVTEKVLALHRTDRLTSLMQNETVELTGPAMWTDAVFRYLNSPEAKQYRQNDLLSALGQDISWRQMTGMTEQRQFADVVVLPITGFSPGQGHMGSEPFDHPMAMVKHDFEGSWKPEDERMKDRDEKGRPLQWDAQGNVIPYPD